ncbi:hypothetical protein A616_17160 [Brevibacillus brevis X23]|nr:hypothetical protein A616_17160 [Brevibacillus brevis X23]
MDSRDVYVYRNQIGQIYGTFNNLGLKLASIEDIRKHTETWHGVINVCEGQFIYSDNHEDYILKE